MRTQPAKHAITRDVHIQKEQIWGHRKALAKAHNLVNIKIC
jgi:hypothetical protein